MKRRIARQVFFIMLSVLVALGMSLHLLQADGMTGQAMTNTMVMVSDMGAAGPSDCHACGKSNSNSNAKMMSCGSICTASVVALLPQGLPINQNFALILATPAATPLLPGRMTAPDPSPPKSSYLA